MAKQKQMRDPNVLVIDVPAGSPWQAVHNRVLADIVVGLDKSGYRQLNYDHVTVTVPKHEVPLTYGSRRADIAIGLGPHHLALVEITIAECAQKLSERK